MADDADVSVAKEELLLDAGIQHVLQQAAAIPKGEPGECRFCGEDSPRLVGRACARCRDKRKLP